MLNALTERERRILLAILAVLVLGAAVKLWRWRVQQHSEPVEAAKAAAVAKTGEARHGDRGDDRAAFPRLTTLVACGDGGRVAQRLF